MHQLMPHQKEILIAAVRRDMRNEESRAISDPAWAEYHRDNARHLRDILEALNPKHPDPRFNQIPVLTERVPVEELTQYAVAA